MAPLSALHVITVGSWIYDCRRDGCNGSERASVLVGRMRRNYHYLHVIIVVVEK